MDDRTRVLGTDIEKAGAHIKDGLVALANAIKYAADAWREGQKK